MRMDNMSKLNFGKKNYAYAYTNLQRDGEKTKKLLSSNILSVIDDSKLNQKSLDTLNLALELVGSYTEKDSIMEPLVDLSSSPEQQVYDYQFSIIMDNTPEKPMTSEMANYKVVEMMLARYITDFQFLLNDIYKDIKQHCENNDSVSLNNLISENNWMSDVLADNDGALGVVAAKNGYNEVLQILYSKSPEMKNYLQKLLNVAAENNQLTCIQYLLAQNADPLPLLDSGKYYKQEQIELINLFTEHLSAKGKSDNSNYYMGMFEYKNEHYKEALKYFEQVVPLSDVAQLALFYQGCCYQYLSDRKTASACFERLVKAYPANNSLVIKAQKHMDDILLLEQVAKEFEERQEKMKKMLVNIFSNAILNKVLYTELAQKTDVFMQEISKQNNVGVTKSFKELCQLLAETKYVKMQKEVSENVLLALEFQDTVQIYEQFVSQFTSKDKSDFPEYTQGLNIIDNMSALIGEVSNGMIVED